MRYLLTALILIILVTGCTTQSDTDEVLTDKVYPDQESWDSQIILTKEGVKRAVINSKHLRKFGNRSEILMDEGVDVDFFDIYESHLSHLKSQNAKVNERTNDLFAKGNVVVVSDSGVTLYTEELYWDHKKEKIVTDLAMMLVTDQDTLYGIGFESDSDLENWIINKPTGVTDRIIKE